MTISAYLNKDVVRKSNIKLMYDLEKDRGQYLLGELNIIKNNERTFDVQYSSVINSGCDVVISGHCLDMGLRIICHI